MTYPEGIDQYMPSLLYIRTISNKLEVVLLKYSQPIMYRAFCAYSNILTVVPSAPARWYNGDGESVPGVALRM